MDKRIILTDKYFIARGGERDCYLHPFDSTKVVKVLYKTYGTNRDQNELEDMYLNFLEKSQVPFTHIAKCFGYADTNLGKALVFDKVFNYTGEISTSFRDMIMQGLLDYKMQDVLVKELKEYLFKNNILFVDWQICKL